MSESPARRSGFAADVLKLASGTTVAQALGVLIMPLLTRLYGPAAFGVLALFTSVTSILGVIACLRYEMAILLPETDEEAANLVGVSLLAAGVIAALSALLVTLGRPLLLRLLNSAALGPYLWAVPVMVLSSGVFYALNYWNSRTKNFGRLSAVRVMGAVGAHATKLAGGLAGHATGGMLVVATLLGSGLSAGVLGRRIWRDDGALFRRSIRLSRMRESMARYRKFPLIDVWSALLNTASWQLPALMLNYAFSEAVAGHYALGVRVLQMPMSLIGGAIGQVFFARAAEAQTEGALDLVVKNTFQQLSKIGLFPVLAVAVAGRDAFSVVFGAQWAQAGVYAQILSLWFFCGFIASPLSSAITVSGKLSFGLLMTVLGLATRAASLLVGGLLRSPELGLAALSISGCLVYVLLLRKVFAIAGVPAREALSSLWQVLLAFAPAGSLLVLIQILRLPPWITAVAMGLAIVVYYWRLVRRDAQYAELVKRVLSRAQSRR